MEKIYTNRELFEIVKRSHCKAIDHKLRSMSQKLCEKAKCQGDADICIVNNCLETFKLLFKRKWIQAQRKEDRFLMANGEWLAKTVKIPVFASSSSGRPHKEFSEASERTRRRKTEELREQITSDELTFAASMSHRSSGNMDAAGLMKQMMETPSRATKMRRALTSCSESVKLAPEEALELFVNADLTKAQYDVIRSYNIYMFPCYKLLQKAKVACYPNQDAITVTETSAEVKLQPLLDHTTTRLTKYLGDVFNFISSEERQSLELISKWGCDGSHQNQFRQKMTNKDDTDTHLFHSSLVPIKLIAHCGLNKKTIWQNPTPSSTRYCRPIRFRFIRENRATTNEEINYIEEQIRQLQKTEVVLNGNVLKIKHELALTMIDGKVCNAATGTLSTMRCYICGQTSKDFNKLDTASSVNENNYRFGLSTLHARIRFFESLLHLAYRLPVKKWNSKGIEEKEIINGTKRRIQKQFEDEMGLLVDVPKPGFGCTNDGNTARRFFDDPETAARITGVDVALIKRMKVILEVISCGFEIDVDKFSQYANDTAKLYVSLYNWHPMTPTMHKIFIHGAAVIQHAILPIGQLSEDAAEARNKHNRWYREKFSRKCSREATNVDVLNRLLMSSDPYLSCRSKTSKRNGKPLSNECVHLLIAGMPNTYNHEEHGSSDEEAIDDEFWDDLTE